MTVLSATTIIFLDGPRVGSPSSMAYLVVINRPVSPVYKMPMVSRVWSLKPSMCGV